MNRFLVKGLFISPFNNLAQSNALSTINLPLDAIQIYLSLKSQRLGRPSERQLRRALPSNLPVPVRHRYFHRTSARSYKPRFYKTDPQIHDFGSRELCRDETAIAKRIATVRRRGSSHRAIKITFARRSSPPSRILIRE